MKKEKIKKNLDTICIQGGYQAKDGEPQVVPICQSTTYRYKDCQAMADLFDLKSDGYFYSRLANPTVSVLEKKLSALEGGVSGVAFASGMSAIMMSVMNVAEAGDNIVAARMIYGGTYNLFGVTLPKFGIETRFIDIDDDESKIEKLIDDKTKLLYIESIANPQIAVADFDKFAKICKRKKLLLFVDNTLQTPIFCRPIEYGANVIIHSTTKYVDGHATSLGGVAIDGGNFEFSGNERYPDFNVPDESYHGLVYAKASSSPFALKLRAQLIRDGGAIMAPQNAFLTNLGCETLALRMKKHSENAIAVAEYLYNHEKIEWVKHTSLKTDKYYELGQKYFDGYTGMMSFAIKGDRQTAAKFIGDLKMISQVTHVADIRSCVLHPASTTHRQLSDEDLKLAGISEKLIRLSVGIENVEDIISDLEQALKRV